MRIRSRAGNFSMTIEDVTVEAGELAGNDREDGRMVGQDHAQRAGTPGHAAIDEDQRQGGGFPALFAFRYIVNLVEQDRARQAVPGAGKAPALGSKLD